MRNKKGFTLTEILGVLVIMGLLLLIIVPTTLNKDRTSENDVKQSQNKMIEESTSIYMDKDKEQYPNVRGNNYCIPVEKMIENGTISDDLKDATSKDPVNYLFNFPIFVERELNFGISWGRYIITICNLAF